MRDQPEWLSRHAHEVEKFCMFFDSAEIAQAALPRFRALPGVEAVQGSPDNVEVTAQGVDKGTALLALADMLGIPREATAAIGDSENDRAMLARAGVAAVMANALPEIRALGGYRQHPRQRPRRRCRAVSAARAVTVGHFCAMYTSSYAKHCAC